MMDLSASTRIVKFSVSVLLPSLDCTQMRSNVCAEPCLLCMCLSLPTMFVSACVRACVCLCVCVVCNDGVAAHQFASMSPKS